MEWQRNEICKWEGNPKFIRAIIIFFLWSTEKCAKTKKIKTNESCNQFTGEKRRFLHVKRVFLWNTREIIGKQSKDIDEFDYKVLVLD